MIFNVQNFQVGSNSLLKWAHFRLKKTIIGGKLLMSQNIKITLVLVFVLAIIGIPALMAGSKIYIPIISNDIDIPNTPDPCQPNPYPKPTGIICPTKTNTPNPYLPPEPTQPLETITPKPPNNSIYIILPSSPNLIALYPTCTILSTGIAMLMPDIIRLNLSIQQAIFPAHYLFVLLVARFGITPLLVDQVSAADFCEHLSAQAPNWLIFC